MKKQSIWKIFFLAIIVSVTLAIITINLQPNFLQIENQSTDGTPRAAIIDQLHNEKPNKNFQQNVTKYRELAGYEVDFYTTDIITVNFYQYLPSFNYEFIIIRSHSLGIGTVEESSSLFTGEIQSDFDYINDQYNGLVGHGVPFFPNEIDDLGGFETLQNKTYFVIGSKFINERMVGTFPNSKIILAGCETTEGTHLVESLLLRGASEVVGWDGLVSSRQNDEVIMKVLEETLVNGIELEDSVESVMKQYEQKLLTDTALSHYSTGA